MREAHGGWTSATEIGTTGEGHHKHRGDRARGGVGHGPVEQLAIADRPGGTPMTPPLGRHHKRRPAQLVSRPGNGGISATGSAMKQQVYQPAAEARRPARPALQHSIPHQPLIYRTHAGL
jgi:hypothetical protein